jgi:hypothetical protein
MQVAPTPGSSTDTGDVDSGSAMPSGDVLLTDLSYVVGIPSLIAPLRSKLIHHIGEHLESLTWPALREMAVCVGFLAWVL